MKRFIVLFVALVAAALIAFAGHDAIALVVVIAGFLSLGRVALLPVIQLILLVIGSAVGLLILYLPYRLFGNVPFEEFLDESWFAFFFWMAFGMWGIWRLRRDSEVTWEVIRDHYAESIDAQIKQTAHGPERGFLGYEQEALPIDTYLADSGIVLARPHGETLCIPWPRVLELRTKDDRPHTEALVTMSRTLTVSIPWRTEFVRLIPEDVFTRLSES